MSVSSQHSTHFASQKVIEQCVELARDHGVGEFKSERRSTPRLPFVHPVRYCLDSFPYEAHTHPGYALNISMLGMAIYCRQTLSPGDPICVCLPLPDGTNTWVGGKVVRCEPEEEYYCVGISFPMDDKADYSSC